MGDEARGRDLSGGWIEPHLTSMQDITIQLLAAAWLAISPVFKKKKKDSIEFMEAAL